jgi:tripartite-type tricarboxylate transporter receptor subunit TctC
MATASAAAGAASYFEDKQLEIIVGVSPGGGYDLNARILASNLSRHLPGKPSIIVRNMPGAGGVKAANFMANVAQRDGTIMSLPLSSIVSGHLLQPERMRYDPVQFNWVGTITSMSDTIAVWHTAPVKTVEGAKRTELILGTSSKSSQLYQEPALMNALLGTKFKVVQGYKGGTEINLAMERGEIHGRSNIWSSWKAQKSQWLAEGKIVHLVQIGPKIDELPDVPSLIDLVKSDRDKAMVEFLHSIMTMGRSIYTTPAVPADRVEVLRAAFMATMKDAAYLKEMTSKKMPVSPMPGDVLQQYVVKTMKMPKQIIEDVKKAIQ